MKNLRRNTLSHCKLCDSSHVAGIATLFFIAMFSVSSSAYLLDGAKWFRGEAYFYVSIPGQTAAGNSWNSAVVDAIKTWNDRTVFNFTVVEETRDPCAHDGYSSIGFTKDLCGSEFGANTLGVAFRRFELQELGPPNIIEGDIIINAAESYDIFDGPLLRFGIPDMGVDFKRIVLHELGHVIGLDHEETVPAIMAPTLGDVFELQEDDIAGVKALYSGLDNCKIQQLTFGTYTESLNGNDCTVQELTVGGTDDSFIDLYQFEVSQTSQFEFSTVSKSLDVVLLIATTDLKYLAVDTASVSDCNSSLTQTLDNGSYFLMVNTYDRPIKPDCGTSGEYTLSASFKAQVQPELGPSTSLLGSLSEARFFGGITSDDGASFSNAFSPTDSLDISADIKIDVSHVGQPGFLVIAAALPDQLLMLNDEGQFVDIGSAASPLVVFTHKKLEESEQLLIAQDLVPMQVGVIQLEANIFVGYGLDAYPDEVYYHAAPMNLTVQPSSDTGI